MKLLKLICLGIFISLNACKTEVHQNDLSWIIGSWQIEDKPVFEEWIKVNDHLYRGKGYQVRKNDTLVTETLEIVQIGKEIFYIPTVSDQNEGQAVMFKLISHDPEKLIFENKSHDFPQKISYQKNGKDRIEATIEGQGKNGYSKMEFHFIKNK